MPNHRSNHLASDPRTLCRHLETQSVETAELPASNPAHLGRRAVLFEMHADRRRAVTTSATREQPPAVA